MIPEDGGRSATDRLLKRCVGKLRLMENGRWHIPGTGDYESRRQKRAILPGELACKATEKGGEEYLCGGNANCVGGLAGGHLHGGDLVGTWKWHGEDDVEDRLPLSI